MYKRYLEIHNNMVEFCCINSKCKLTYRLPMRFSEMITAYKCQHCGGRAIKLIDDNVVQIYPKRRRF